MPDTPHTPRTEPPELLVGGVNLVERHGDRVRRPAGPWSPTVQRLLAHLHAHGFTGCPTPHGVEPAGDFEWVSYLPGDVGHDFLAPEVRSDATLTAAARLLRAFHDATTGFGRGPDDHWQFTPRQPEEVVCHGDAATYNTVFRDGLPVAFIDFDTAHPGPRLWDLGHTAYRFVPLYAPDAEEAADSPEEARRRLRLFCDAYGLDDAQRRAVPTAAAERLRTMVDHMRTQAAAGSTAFQQHLAEGHDQRYLRDIAWLTEQGAILAG